MVDTISHYIIGTAILCPTNAEAIRINEQLLNAFTGDETIFKSIDEVIADPNNNRLGISVPGDSCIENFNRKTPSDLPPHELRIKKGAIVMLIRNIDITEGLCNGTRLQVHLVSLLLSSILRSSIGPMISFTSDI